jgi:threonylcarbamoyladenosine tRNA methylthiotransferase MtaB
MIAPVPATVTGETNGGKTFVTSRSSSIGSRVTIGSVSAPRIAAVITLGCKLNLADSDEIGRRLQAHGFAVTDRLCEASAYVLNTCSVTHVADQKSRRLIRAARKLSPGAVVAVTGCYPQSAGAGRVMELGADIVVGTRDGDKDHLVRYVVKRAAATDPQAAVPSSHTRAFIKAQEGCNDVCAFCIVPRTRHREESRPVDRVVDEVRQAVERGAREAVITGTQLGAWGRDLDPAMKPHALIAGVLDGTDIARLRFSSLQPQDITPDLLATWQDPRVMPHFHLALQSGSEAVLKAMRRRYTAAAFLAAVERIRASVPGVAITTDIIAGFPGETDADFDDTLRLSREAGFARIHAFPYSQRSGTTATKLPRQVAPEAKRERMARLKALGEDLGMAFRRDFAGSLRSVLWERERSIGGQTLWHGYTDNYIAVYAAGERLANRITMTRLGQPVEDGLTGEVAG